MQIVNRVHMRKVNQLVHHFVLIDMLWGLGHEGAHTADGRALGCEDHQNAEEHRAAGVGVAPLADAAVRDADVEGLQPDAEGGHAHAEGLHDVADDMRYGCLHRRPCLLLALPMAVAMVAGAVAVAVTVAEHLHQDKVHEETNGCNHQHDRSVYGLRVQKPVHGCVQQHGGQRPDNHDRQQRAKHLGLLKPIGKLRRGLHFGELESQQRNDEAAHIGEHVRGVGHDGQGVCHDAAHDLHEHEEEGTADRPLHLPLVVHDLALPVLVAVAVPVAVAVAVTVAAAAATLVAAVLVATMIVATMIVPSVLVAAMLVAAVPMPVAVLFQRLSMAVAVLLVQERLR
mmetsp:Transcript_77395/g.226979  ORF Transcript_77395/g.226979 Transcript_77395/m.226979 type:complete len:341 (-) Transcript_77395:108-1130(-)